MTITEAPQISILLTGDSFKVLQVRASAGMLMPEHFCTQEAVILVQKGSAILAMGGSEYPLKRDQSFIIPAGKRHTLRIVEDFESVVMMQIDSEIKFSNV